MFERSLFFLHGPPPSPSPTPVVSVVLIQDFQDFIFHGKPLHRESYIIHVIRVHWSIAVHSEETIQATPN